MTTPRPSVGPTAGEAFARAWREHPHTFTERDSQEAFYLLAQKGGLLAVLAGSRREFEQWRWGWHVPHTAQNIVGVTNPLHDPPRLRGAHFVTAAVVLDGFNDHPRRQDLAAEVLARMHPATAPTSSGAGAYPRWFEGLLRQLATARIDGQCHAVSGEPEDTPMEDQPTPTTPVEPKQTPVDQVIEMIDTDSVSAKDLRRLRKALADLAVRDAGNALGQLLGALFGEEKP